MKVTVVWHDGKYPSFNVDIASAEGKEPFLQIKGCRIASGSKGEFLSWPSTKNEKTGKYWNHVYANNEFADHVLKLAKDSRPVTNAAPRNGDTSGGILDMDSDCPF